MKERIKLEMRGRYEKERLKLEMRGRHEKERLKLEISGRHEKGLKFSVAEPEPPGAGADFFLVGAGSRSWSRLF